MIGINECNPDIANVAKKHIAFVGKRVEENISFYIDILRYIQKIAGKRILKKNMNDVVKSIKVKHNCDHYKLLLNHFLKKGKRIKSEDQLYLIKENSNRISAFKNIPATIKALKMLLSSYDFLISANFNDNAADFTKYISLKQDIAPANFLLERIFDYEWFGKIDNKQPWGPYQLTQAIKMDCCPYCNRQYTFTVLTVGGEKVARPDLDHFLPQSKHPLLALSFYNLVPSCSVCNSSVKGSAETAYDTHFSPYMVNARHALIRFTYQPKDYAASIGESENLEIELKYNGDPADATLQKRVETNMKLFCLKDVYRNHTDAVREIIQKRHATSDQYIKMTQLAFKRLKLSEADAYRLAFGNYYDENEFYKRPLAKLTKDLAIELGILPKFP